MFITADHMVNVFSLSLDDGRLVVATTFDFLGRFYGIAISSPNFTGAVAVETRKIDQLWFFGGLLNNTLLLPRHYVVQGKLPC